MDDLLCADDMELKDSKMVVGHDGSCHFSDMTPIRGKIKAIVPESLLRKMRTIESNLSSTVEFGAFLKGVLTEDGILTIGEDFLILNQTVTTATIDFNENPPMNYNGVIHRHPSGCTRFSGTDNQSINRNHEFSLLYVNNSITTGIINIRTENGFIYQADLVIDMQYPKDENLDVENILKNINTYSLPSSTTALCHTNSLNRWKNNKEFFKSISSVNDDIPVFDDDIKNDEDEEYWDLGQGYTYDGICIRDVGGNIIEDYQLPHASQIELQKILMEEEEF